MPWQYFVKENHISDIDELDKSFDIPSSGNLHQRNLQSITSHWPYKSQVSLRQHECDTGFPMFTPHSSAGYSLEFNVGLRTLSLNCRVLSGVLLNMTAVPL